MVESPTRITRIGGSGAANAAEGKASESAAESAVRRRCCFVMDVSSRGCRAIYDRPHRITGGCRQIKPAVCKQKIERFTGFFVSSDQFPDLCV
jgi:hypothetical protein